jgi:hypothetical protein
MPDHCTPLLDFATAERLVNDLDRCLKPGGYIAFWNCHFRFADFNVAKRYTVVLQNEKGRWANTPLYGPDNRRLEPIPYCDAMFRKSASSA